MLDTEHRAAVKFLLAVKADTESESLSENKMHRILLWPAPGSQCLSLHIQAINWFSYDITTNGNMVAKPDNNLRIYNFW